MIVVDTNTIAYLYLPTAETPRVEKLLELDAAWAAPQLWRSEFRNIMALYVRKDIVDFETACQIQRQAETLMAGGEYEIDSLSVLATAQKSGCSAYDCEFVALAQSLRKTLVTSDKKLLKAFPDIAVTAKGFLSRA
jgi:predicted nucleic acid-binding protein